MRRLAALLLGTLLLGSCAPEPQRADPALWEVTAEDGSKGWLFGTVHALERPALWKTKAVSKALDEAGVVMVEIADAGDRAAIGAVFAELSATSGQPPLTRRVDPPEQALLRAALEEHGISDTGFARVETWAAALSLAQAASRHLESQYGVDKAVLEAARNKRVEELEGTRGQLALFDALPEGEQADLLALIAQDAAALSGESADLAAAWRKGDMAVIERETKAGLLADPELRAALFTDRNAAWTKRIAAAIAKGRKPFVAVGAAHMAGPDGLPAMLEGRGYAVRRVR